MTKEPAEPEQPPPPNLPRHPAARPRAEADRELVPPDADLDTAEGAAPRERR
ncbi:hypothetical protein QLQ12_00575 [Actinoplanes sp. NEAU-A12]|uniref:Uncharacterized protein n=1 Tax=Actinoplanes sandaracinus TaxID=3045177 RepID=A0ABT6WBJ8_9ACTN|nr:hypothetical protein [Actinoplanes sandaracinus]MDI6097102.1 hypothetical protein [Actinoplanes sandaracinus]